MPRSFDITQHAVTVQCSWNNVVLTTVSNLNEMPAGNALSEKKMNRRNGTLSTRSVSPAVWGRCVIIRGGSDGWQYLTRITPSLRGLILRLPHLESRQRRIVLCSMR